MKSTLIICLFFSSYLIFSQNEKTTYFDEVSFGFSQSYIKKDYINSEEFSIINQFGVNLDAMHTAFKGKRLNVLYGFEYNMVKFKLNYSLNFDRYDFQREHNITFHKITAPITIRLNLGEQHNLFVEVGGYFDFIDYESGNIKAFGVLKEGFPVSENYPYKVAYEGSYYKTGINLGGHIGIGSKFHGVTRDYVGKISFRRALLQSQTYTGYNNLFFSNYFKFSFGIQLNKTIVKSAKRKFTHTFYLGQPRGLFHGSNIAISGHYEFGILKSEKNMQEIKVSYVLYKYSGSGGWLSYGQLNGNSQTFILQYGGRHYFNRFKNKIRPYISGHLGVENVNYESGKNRILPAFSGGVHLEIDHRFNVGFDIEGLMPNAYLKVGYRFY